MNPGSLQYIRDYYDVPAKLDGRVIYDGVGGTIVGAQNAHLLIQLDGAEQILPYHPTSELTYL